MDIFDLNVGDELVLGIRAQTAEAILKRHDGDYGRTKLDEMTGLLTAHMEYRSHQSAEEDDGFLQIVPCVMVQGVPTRLVRTIQGKARGYDGDLISICAHCHVHSGMTIQAAIEDLLHNKMRIERGQLWNKLTTSVSIPLAKPANGRHLIISYACRVIDFRERDVVLPDASLQWVSPEALRAPEMVERFDPWCQLLYKTQLVIADATARDITMRFVMVDGQQALEILPDYGRGA